LAGRTKLHLIGKKLMVDGVGTPLDNDAVRL